MTRQSPLLCDVSFIGASIMIGGMEFTQFVDDANPIEFGDIDLARVEFSLNGSMIRTVCPVPVVLSISVIAGSDDDLALSKMAVGSYMGKDGAMRSAFITAAITTADGSYTLDLKGGTMIKAPIGITARSDGKIVGRKYTFAFQSVA